MVPLQYWQQYMCDSGGSDQRSEEEATTAAFAALQSLMGADSVKGLGSGLISLAQSLGGGQVSRIARAGKDVVFDGFPIGTEWAAVCKAAPYRPLLEAAARQLPEPSLATDQQGVPRDDDVAAAALPDAAGALDAGYEEDEEALKKRMGVRILHAWRELRLRRLLTPLARWVQRQMGRSHAALAGWVQGQMGRGHAALAGWVQGQVGRGHAALAPACAFCHQI